MTFQHNLSLEPFNTFGIDVSCKLFAEINSKEDVHRLIESNMLSNEKHLILGGGSNILFTKDFDGIVIKANNQFIEIVESNDDLVYVKAGAGVLWDDLIDFALTNNLSGIENLIGIPGTVGASAYQNIGAYGVEAKDCIEEVEVINLLNGKHYVLKNEDCAFEYRNSIFKQNTDKSEFIYAVTYKLSTNPNLNTTYGSIQQELEKLHIAEPSIRDIADIINRIRVDKLPSVDEIGSGGSFFKNPSISNEQHELLKSRFPNIVAYPNANGTVKISAGWLIDQCGWKGKTVGNAGVYDKQALVLVNMGNATGSEIKKLSEMIQQSVNEKFGIELEPEVLIL